MATPGALLTPKRVLKSGWMPAVSPSTSSSASFLSNGRHHPQPAAAGSRSFSRGAVIKLRLENFLTFDRVVIRPQPQLNVIVGPNGTGKSSIVCAICLGLGGSTALLGRAKDLKDFVKHGKESGFVEITLYDDRAARHPVIRRTLSASSSSSEWTVNRRNVLEKEVKKLVESLNIQLDNRCMFLPQDKVVEFARMNKQELLMETERALGPKELFQHHEELKGLKAKYSDAIDSLKRMRKELENLQRQNNLLQRDVERFKSKEKYEKEIVHLKLKKLWLQTEDLKSAYRAKKEECKAASEELKEMKEQYQPIKEQHKRQEEAVVAYQGVAQEAMRQLRRLEAEVRDHEDKLVMLGDKVEQPGQELEALKKQEADRKKKIDNLQREIEAYRKDLEELEPVESLTPKIADKNSRIRGIQHEIGDIKEQQTRLMEEKEQLEDIIRQDQRQLKEMNSVRAQRLQKLEARDSDTARAIRWLEENQHQFRQPILEPVCMSLNVLNPRYVKQAEAFFGGRDFMSFVAQNEEDREAFLKAVRDSSMRLRINIVRSPSTPLREFRPDVPFSTLQQYGFQEMLLNVVEAPEPVLAYFCQYQGLCSVPIAGSIRMEQVARITSEVKKLRIFFTDDTRYSVKTSRYRADTSTRTFDLYPPKFLVSSVDNQRKQELEMEITSKSASLSELDQHYLELEKKDKHLRQKDAKLRHEKQELRKIQDSHKSHRTNISTRQKRLQQCLDTTFDVAEAERKCEEEVSKIQQERVKCLRELKKLVRSAVDCLDASIQATLNVSTAETRVGFFLRRFRLAKNAYDDAEQKVKTLMQEEKDKKVAARDMYTRAVRETGCQNVEKERPELLLIFSQFPNEVEALDDFIHELKAKAEMCVGTDESTVREYKAREQKIHELTLEIANMKSGIDNKDERIKELKQSWLVPLTDLIGQVNRCFQSYFSQHMGMECAGEVRLDPDPESHPDFSEFDKYGVQIKVKFRDSEQLHELDAQRQSGGERSVSTMLYLMALQGNTSCPFRVVDEINQGMDPTNERRIFNLIVQSAYEGAQYFLLTPKLLQNLEYSEAVAIHLVHNGQEMMECDQWNLAQILG